MTYEIVVPEMGESIFEAAVARWLKQEGEQVSMGEAVVELETDKVNLEVGSEQAGLLVSIKRHEGEDVAIGEVLGLIEESSDGGEPSVPEEKAAGPAEKSVEVKEGPEPEEVQEPTREEEEKEEKPSQKTEERVTPMARRLAEEHGLDLARVAAAGERVTREDVERLLDEQQPEPEAEPEAVAAPKPPASIERPQPEERIRLTRRRQTIARRLVEAQQTAAMLTTFNELDMSAVIDLRQRRRDAFQERHGVKLGFMSFFVKAAVGALKQFPRLNAEIDGNEMVLKHYYDIGIAVSTAEGLVVPVVRAAERLSFAQIEQAINDYARKAGEGTLSLEDLRGGTFTITNGGVFGSLLSTPILNPPQVGILGLHKIEARPVVVNDRVVVRPMMYVALSYDHRIVDGREAVQFLGQIKALIEEPEELLLEG